MTKPLPAKPKLGLGSIVAFIDNEEFNPHSRRATGPVTGPATDPVTTPATGPATGPVTTPAAGPVTAPATRPATRPVTAPVTTPVTSPVTGPATGPVTAPTPFVYLDSTHTASEQRVYSVMYRETINKGISRRHFTAPDLMKLTGIRSDKTVRMALKGLTEKLSIVEIGIVAGDPSGKYFEVRTPKDILAARRKVGLQIEDRTKHVVTAPVTGPATDPETAVENTQAPPVNFTGHDKYKNNLPVTQPSSVPSGSDDDKLTKVRKLFEQLSSGGQWKDDRDLKAYEQIAHVGIFHIVLGLCYSVTKSPEHRMSSLAYAVPSILDHVESMDEFPAEQLIEIAYRTKRKTLNCIAEGKWTLPDWET